LGFVYCDHVSREEQTATRLIGALLGQLINYLSFDNIIAKELAECQRKEKLLDLKTSVLYIQRIACSGQFTAVRLGADGLDELLPEHRATFLTSLGSLFIISNIRFLFIGRDNSGIQTEVGNSFGGPDSFICHRLASEGTADDRRLFLQQCLDHSKDWYSLDDGLKGMIFSQLAGPESTSVFRLIAFNNG
jgi:hypothetical protein